jgi:hypothetical protein
MLADAQATVRMADVATAQSGTLHVLLALALHVPAMRCQSPTMALCRLSYLVLVVFSVESCNINPTIPLYHV